MLKFLQKGPKEGSRKGVNRENRGFEGYRGQKMKWWEVEDLNKGSTGGNHAKLKGGSKKKGRDSVCKVSETEVWILCPPPNLVYCPIDDC